MLLPQYDLVWTDNTLEHTCSSIMPLLRLAVGGAAAVDEARHIAFVPGVNDKAWAELHHVEVGLPGLLGHLHAPLTLHVAHHFPCSSVPLQVT